MGSEASPKQIENAFEERGDNEALEAFKEFMRTPPLMPVESDQLKVQHHLQGKLQFTHPYIDIPKFDKIHPCQPTNVQVMALHNFVHSQRSNVVLGSNNEGKAIVRRLPPGQSHQQVVDDVSMVLSNRYLSDSGESSRKVITYNKVRGGKRQFDDDSFLPFTSDDIPCKCRKYDDDCLKIMRTGSKRKNAERRSATNCRELVKWEQIANEDFIILLIKRILPSDSQVITSEEYYLFLYHTVSGIMQKCGVSESSVLSILLEDFDEIDEYKTKRGHIAYIIDTNDCVFTLGGDEYENLSLYTKHARPRIIKRLNKEDKYANVNSNYLFIDYDGIPVVEKFLQTTQNMEKSADLNVSEMTTYHKRHIIDQSQVGYCSDGDHFDRNLCTPEIVHISEPKYNKTSDDELHVPAVNFLSVVDEKASQEHSDDYNVIESPTHNPTILNPYHALERNKDNESEYFVKGKDAMKQDLFKGSEGDVQSETPETPIETKFDDTALDSDNKAEGIESFINDISKLLSNDKMP